MLSHYLALFRSPLDKEPFACYETFFQPDRDAYIELEGRGYRVSGRPWFVVDEHQIRCCVQATLLTNPPL